MRVIVRTPAELVAEYDLPDLEDCNEVVIDKDVVEGRKEPIRVYAEKKKDGAGAAA